MSNNAKRLSSFLLGNEYMKAIQDLNRLQSNTKIIALAKYKDPEKSLPLFAKQLKLAGIEICDLNKLNIIHVTGTKGKGSTCAYVESILRAAGEKTGFYNSPHLVKVTERIRINGKPIDDEKFTNYFRQIYDRLIDETKRENVAMPGYFSFLTILAFHIFLKEKVDCAVVEVGIGGEYDFTNIIQEPVACGISTLDYDHTDLLGNTIESIAWTKAGIAKRNVPIFTIGQEYQSALNVIERRALELGSPFYICNPLTITQKLQLGIQGSAQYSNASLACQLARYFLETRRKRVFNFSTKISDTKDPLFIDIPKLPNYFIDALADCSLLGRCQVLKYPRVTFFLDGAHTRKSMENCLDWFLKTSESYNSTAYRILMVNIIGKRKKEDVLEPLVEYNKFNEVFFTSNRIESDDNEFDTVGFGNDSCLENVQVNAETWRLLLKKNGYDKADNISIMANTSTCIKFIDRLSRLDKEERMYHVLITGSLHFVGANLEAISNNDNLLKS